MEKSIVALVPCSTYDEEQVFQAAAQGVSLLGGLDKWISREDKILIKPNMLGKAAPQRAVTTHPAVFKAVARLLKEDGFDHLSYGDSPSVAAPSPQSVAESCLIAQAAREMDIPLADFQHGRQVSFAQGRACKSFHIANGALEADALINVCKMKTHALERLTGAVKNTYGCIPGVNKGTGHAKYPDAVRFARMLADLCSLLKPRLHIMDGIVAMEGNGPSSGTPVSMNVLLFSTDPVALDTVFCHLVHLSPSDIPTCIAGEQAGIGHWREEEIEVRTPEGVLSMGEMRARYGNPRFIVYRGDVSKGLIGRVLRLIPGLQDKPVANPALCIRCGDCVKSCPVEGKALALDKTKDRAPRYDYSKCIRCYCCQEVCPAKAISVSEPLGRKKAGKA